MNLFKIGKRWVNAKEMRKIRDKKSKKTEVEPAKTEDEQEAKFPGAWCELCGSKGSFHKKGCPLK